MNKIETEALFIILKKNKVKFLQYNITKFLKSKGIISIHSKQWLLYNKNSNEIIDYDVLIEFVLQELIADSSDKEERDMIVQEFYSQSPLRNKNYYYNSLKCELLDYSESIKRLIDKNYDRKCNISEIKDLLLSKNYQEYIDKKALINFSSVGTYYRRISNYEYLFVLIYDYSNVADLYTVSFKESELPGHDKPYRIELKKRDISAKYDGTEL